MPRQHENPSSRAPRALLATLLVAALGLSAASGAAAQEVSPYGVNVHAPGGEQLALLDRVAEAGIGWVRIDFVWAAIEREKGVYDWSHYDALVGAARARGLEILAIIAYTPKWATDGPEVSGVPRDVEDWRRFCRRAALRYRHSILAWEVWNEPNLPRFWSGTRDQYIEGILIPAADAIHAANPEARVAGPGLAHLTSASWPNWLLDTLERAGDRLDVVTHHLYDGDGYADVTEKLDGSTRFANTPAFWRLEPPSVREVLKRADARDKPFWLTETGWESGDIGEEAQAANVSGLLEQWLGASAGSRNWVQKVFLYELEDAPGFSFGLLRPDYSTKPAYHALRTFVAGHPAAVPVLELHGGRFALSAEWRDHDGRRGTGQPLPFSQQSGRFWFFGPGNVELLAKVLDGSGVNDRAWVFRGALSDVEYWLTVTDRATGTVRRYHNPPRTLCGGADTAAFPWQAPAPALALASGSAEARSSLPAAWPGGGLSFGAASSCVAAPATLCLGNGRFRVRAEWRSHDGATGAAEVASVDGDSGAFWFFDPGNLELAVKVLDGRPVNGRFWVFFGALSDVEYWVTVTDTATGVERQYHNAAGTLCGRGDVEAF